MAKPKIIVCATAYRPLVGGAEIAVEEVARRLAGDFDFFILTARMARDIPVREIGPEGAIVRLGFGIPMDKWLLPFFAVWHAHTIIHRGDRVLLWGMDISQGAVAALCIGLHFRRLPFVMTAQYGESEDYLNTGRGGWIRRVFHMLLMRADRVTVISSYLQRVVRSHGYCGPCAVIPNGADVRKFQISNYKLQINAENKIRKSKTVITISRLVPKNGVDTLIRAIAEVKKKIPDVRCFVAGEGPEREKLEALVRSLDLSREVSLLGTVAHEKLPDLLHSAAVFVRMSRSEGMGNVFVEAAAAGVPIVATAVGGITDIIEDENTGLLAASENPEDAAEKIIRILRDPAFAEAMAARAREKIIRRFDWTNIAREYQNVFLSALSAEKRMTVAAGLFPPDIGGPATYTAVLADALPYENIAVRVSYFGAVRHLPRLARHAVYCLRLWFSARGSDIVFAQDPVSVGLPALIISRVLGTCFVLKMVGDYAWEQYQVKSQKIKDKKGKQDSRDRSFETLEEFQNKKYDAMTEVRRRVQCYVARRADCIIVPSEYLRGIVAGWGVAGEKIAVVYNAVATPEQGMPREQARERLGVSGIAIISVGRLVPWKGFTMLIESVAELAEEFPEICLVIAGAGPEEKNLRRNIKERGAERYIRLLGAISHEALMAYFAASDIFVLNSGYEGLSHSLIEAMAAGLPSIVTRVGGNPEVVTDGTEGILIEYGDKGMLKDALTALAANADRRVAMGTAARRRAAAFTTEKMIRETAIILKAL